MTLENYLYSTQPTSDVKNKKRTPTSHVINKINTIIDSLEGFKGNANKRMNISRLAKKLGLSDEESEDILDMVLKLQGHLHGSLKTYRLKKTKTKNGLYLGLEEAKTTLDDPKQTPLKEMVISEPHLKRFSDVMYVFFNVKKGIGFDVSHPNPNMELINSLLIMKDAYPCLFERRENGLIYPSKLGLTMGENVLMLNKSGKTFKELKLDGITIKVKE